MVQVAGRPGDIGKYANIVVPDERDIHRLRPFLRFWSQMRPTPLNRRSASRGSRRLNHSLALDTTDPYKRDDNFSLFQKP